ncbi:M48 family metallopeptidase [Aestuariicoccus sp. MJ-SS9]|uniref:M48 family metallopeptidase n=1 Tax=Aestuariicoccus sp. MJ-SS9 TaxID=3079855 RepID=UPI00290FD069|nr:M48 family metallopeptidase [Aestuariicoccus sp. MJ-SS9]MDU8912625.1 M48 family metallopeptidase [Aestuariicoccus sp. MJ-SS9]
MNPPSHLRNKAACEGTPEQNAAANAAKVLITTSADPDTQRNVAVTALPDVLRGKKRSEFRDVERYLQGIVDRIDRANDLDDFSWDVYLLSDRSANASTLGGGVICVNEGILLHTRNEADIAIILAHEMAHSTEGDAVNRQRNDAILAAGVVAMRQEVRRQGKSGNQWIDLAINLGTAAVVGASSQGREARADRIGFHYYRKAGYQPAAAPAIFDRLRKVEGSNRSALAVFNSHPGSRQRADTLRQLAAKTANRNSGRVNTRTWSGLIAKVEKKYKRKD